jgi:fucose permease
LHLITTKGIKLNLKNRFATIVNFAILTVFAMNLTIISPLLESIRNTYSLSISESGLIFTISFVGFLVFVLLGGILADRYGKKIVLLFALSGFTILLFAFSVSPNFIVLCIIIFFIGGFGGVIESMTMAAISDLNPHNSIFYINLSQVFFGIGAIVGPILAGIVVSSGLSWQICYVVLGIFSLALTLVLSACKMPKVTSSNGFSLTQLKYCLKNTRFLLICLCLILYTGSEVGGWGWLCTLLKQKFAFGISQSSVAVAVFWVAMTVGRFVCGTFTSRFKTHNIIICLAFCSAVVTLLSSIVTNQFAIWFVIVFMGLTYSSQFPLIVSYGNSHSKTPSGTSFAILLGFGSVGSMSVPYFMGIIGSLSTMSMAMLLPAVLLFFVGIIFTMFRKECRA